MPDQTPPRCHLLQELLRFEGDSEDEEDEEDEEGEDEEEEEEESEDEEGEADSDEAGGAGAQKQLPGGEKIVTLAMVADWQKNLRGSKDRAVLKAAVLAFHAAAQASGADEEEDGAAEPSPYRILEPRGLCSRGALLLSCTTVWHPPPAHPGCCPLPQCSMLWLRWACATCPLPLTRSSPSPSPHPASRWCPGPVLDFLLAFHLSPLPPGRLLPEAGGCPFPARPGRAYAA